MVNQESVLDALRVVIDPDLHRDIVSLGFVKDLKVPRQPCVVRAAAYDAGLPGERPAQAASRGRGERLWAPTRSKST
jgi:hypothetical protein